MNECRDCGGTEFYVDSGYYFCTECQTQSQDRREEVLELRLEGTRVTRKKIPRNDTEKIDETAQWTTWEQYNFILIGLVNELADLGATAEIKLTVLQLWASYLGKAEIAFTSLDRKIVPKLAKNFHKKDSDIIYGKIKAQRQKRRKATSTSSVVSSQVSENSSNRELGRRKSLMIKREYEKFVSSQASDSDVLSLVSQSLLSVRSNGSQSSMQKMKYSKHAKIEMKRLKTLSKHLPPAQRMKYRVKHVTTKYRTGPYVLTPMKLWAILYLALRIHNQDIHLADMLRYAREGNLSYYRLDHLLPEEMTLTDSDVKLITQNNEITHKGMRRTSAEIAKILVVDEISCPDLTLLISRYCKDLNLPDKISTYAGRLIALSPPSMIFNKDEPMIPNYEGRAMAFVIFVLKVLLGMDGITEYELSRIAEKVNRQEIQRQSRSGNICIIVHGGCGQCGDLVVCEKLDGCKKAASFGYKKIMEGGNAIEAVEAALWWLECDESFNCGYGSVLNKLGEVQMDASIMDGDRLEIGSVAAVSDVEHPISLAKFILENYPNTIMVGEGAKNLARCSEDAHLLSEGNMVSPQAILALNLIENCEPGLKYDREDFANADSLKKSWGTAGCLAWDGRSIAAGTTTGGLSGKMVGRVGASPFLGCGTFANNIAGCSLSGHGETISKLGLSRNIVTAITEGSCPEEALESNIESMYRQSNREAGGIVLKKNGCWGIYFNTPRMPYAVVKKNLITFGADPKERKTQAYFAPEAKLPECRWYCVFSIVRKAKVDDCSCISSITMAQDDPCSRLFSFREWQRFIECRRNILMRKHFPTKFRNDPDGLDDPELYVRFIKSALSRREEKPEITNYKNTIPRDLANTLEKCIDMLGESLVESEDVVFSPSLTPQYSYLEQLLEHPMYDLPDILRMNFNDAQVNYLTKPKKLVSSATEFGMKLKIVKSRLHFLDELAPQFERLKMPTLTEWRETVTVVTKTSTKDESSSVHSDNDDAQRFELDKLCQSYYDNIHDNVKAIAVEDEDEEETSFGFDEVESDGKLPVPSFHVSDSDGESVVEPNDETERSNFHQKYNLKLPPCLKLNESESQESFTIPNERKTFTRHSNGKYVLQEKEKRARNSQGKFVSKHSADARQEVEVCETPERVVSGPKNRSAATLEKKLLKNSFTDSDNLFTPCVDYWMYHCVFSKVKPKNFEIFESELPVSFQWLLNECSDLVEMSTEDLYEQVCLVETHFAHVLKADKPKCNSYDSKDNKIKVKMCQKKW